MTIVIEIDGEPVAKGRGKIGRMANGRPVIFTPAKTRANENLIKMAAMAAMKGRDPIKGAVMVRIGIYIALPKSFSKKKLRDAEMGLIRPCVKPDLDNFIKSAMDGLNTIVFVDDNQVVEMEGFKMYRNKPGMRIEVTEIDLGMESVI
jgi:Holliday junction resolvase RusA-like endonuclease